MRNPASNVIYRVSVVRQGVRRTADFPQAWARQVIIDAVRLGFEVSFRRLPPEAPLLPRVQEEELLK